MELKKKQGLSLLELVVAMTLLAVVLFTATALFTSTRRGFLNFETSETSLMQTVRGTFSEMVNRIEAANQVTIPDPASIVIRVDDDDTPEDSSGDMLYTYSLVGTQILYSSQDGTAGVPSASEVVASDVTSLSFAYQTSGGNDVPNAVVIDLVVQPAMPAGAPKETLHTTVTIRGRHAEA